MQCKVCFGEAKTGELCLDCYSVQFGIDECKRGLEYYTNELEKRRCINANPTKALGEDSQDSGQLAVLDSYWQTRQRVG